MKTYEGRVMLEVDADAVGEMLDLLSAFAKSLTPTDRIRVIGYQWDQPKGEVRPTIDVRRPDWKNYTKGGPK